MKKLYLFLCLSFLFSSFLATPAAASTSFTFPDSWDVGQAFVVALSSHMPFDNPSVDWLEQTISLDVEPGREGYVSYALLGSYVRDVKPGKYPLMFDFFQDGKKFRVKCEIQLNERKYPEEHLKVESSMVTPPKSETARIDREAKLAAEARRTMTAGRQWTTPPDRPVTGVVTSSYGFRRVYNGVPRSPHAGTDFRAPTGTTVIAPFAGKAVLTGDHYFAGKSVYIDSGNGVISVFFHLNEINVKEGDQVKKAQTVGKSGQSGRVTGPHLHYGLSLAGQYVDPVPLFDTSVTALLKEMRTEIVRE